MEKSTRVVFMGASDFGIPAFEALVAHPEYDVVGLVTQPDRPAGRGRKVSASPIKEMAVSSGVPVLQPRRLRIPLKVHSTVERLRREARSVEKKNSERRALRKSSR